MVSFRFYVVATVATFLALAMGVVIGSALDQTFVSSLKKSVARVEANLDDSVDAINAKKREIGDLQRSADQTAPFAVQSQLQGTSTVVIAQPNADEDQVRALVTSLRQAESGVQGIVWMEPKWELRTAEDRALLAEATDTPDTGTESTRRRAAWSALMEQIRVAAEPDPAVTTTTLAPDATPTSPVDVFAVPLLGALEADGFVRLQQLDTDTDTVAGGAELLVAAVTSPESALTDRAVEATDLATATAGLGLRSVVAEAYAPGDDNRARATTLSTLRDSSPAGISTVDDLDVVAGRVGTVLALAELRHDRAGHFGYGAGADRVLPEWGKN